ncbi:MAG: TonB-dependent receptor plug domain-containing protein [Thermodesulfobacteriota bacterium]
MILLNGRRVTASTGSTVDLTQISAADIERIEIVKGPVSALYGSDSMAGVINVITSKPPKTIPPRFSPTSERSATRTWTTSTSPPST